MIIIIIIIIIDILQRSNFKELNVLTTSTRNENLYQHNNAAQFQSDGRPTRHAPCIQLAVYGPKFKFRGTV